MYCTKCGATVQEGAAFCRQCGQAVVSRVTMEGASAEGATIDAGVPYVDRGDVAFPPGAPPPLAPYGAAVSTSMGMAPPIAYAGFWLRAVAYLIDSAIMGIVF